MAELKGVCVGGGYFSAYHYEAWERVDGVRIVAAAEANEERGREIRERFGVERVYADYRAMLERERPDFVDVITPPATHREICLAAADLGIPIICQKPLAPTYAEAVELVEQVERHGVRLMVHENFRFQPWHREARRLLDAGAIGDRLHSLAFRCRLGDGWGDDAYLARQPYFRDYPRLFVYETGVHFIDTFRYLAGEVTRVAAWLRKLNPVIAGEDCALLVFDFASGAVGQLDANRYNEPACGAAEARYTFGEMLVEGSGGSLRLDDRGGLTLQKLGEAPRAVEYAHERRGFAGDAVYATQRHFVERLRDGREFETSGREYLKTLAVQEAAYAAAERGCPVDVTKTPGATA